MNKHYHTDIAGLIYIPDFIDPDEEALLLETINHQPWLKDLKRRVQHYGYKYDYAAQSLDQSAYLGALPDWLNTLAERLVRDSLFTKVPEQVIINEYQPGQGISYHRDSVGCFGDTIASLSLASAAVMNFRNTETGDKRDLLLEPKSLVVMKDIARYEWQHAIPDRKNDLINGVSIPRELRISMTFRKII